MEKIVVATNNLGKIKEIKEILKEKEIVSLKEMHCDIEVEEDQDTFEGNALKKAKEIYEVVKVPCIADDSGLCIDFLQGFPGVKTARFLGEQATQEQRNLYILQQLEGVAKSKRSCKMVTVIAYVDKQKQRIFRAELKGYIAIEERGDNGFGFDTIFELEDGRTLAQLSKEEKNKISSRKKALMLCKEEMDSYI